MVMRKGIICAKASGRMHGSEGKKSVEDKGSASEV